MKNIRGISFKVPQVKLDLLPAIFNDINMKNFYWYNVESQNEAWKHPNKSTFLDRPFYNGNDFVSEIQVPHYIVFLKLQIYAKKTAVSDIKTYDDFKNSDCIMLVLINDCEFVEMYIKDFSILHALYDNAKKRGFQDVEFITDEEDPRIMLDVLNGT